jgi:hypothetical protein
MNVINTSREIAGCIHEEKENEKQRKEDKTSPSQFVIAAELRGVAGLYTKLEDLVCQLCLQYLYLCPTPSYEQESS